MRAPVFPMASFLTRPLAVLALCSAALLATSARPARADLAGGSGYIGWYDGDTFLIGGGMHFGAGRFTVTPNAEMYFVDYGSAWSLNLDVTMAVLRAAVANGWVGAGLGAYTVDPDAGSSDTNSAVNLLVGAGLNATRLKPYLQLKYVVVDGDDPLVATLGVRF